MADPDAVKTRVLFDFEGQDADQWSAVNDNVMGGLSAGDAQLDGNVLRFTGNLSLENNGGFSSIRHAINLDLTEYSGIRLRVRGDGRRYQLRLHTDARVYGRPVAFSGTFATQPEQWTEVEVPFAKLQASFRGRQLTEHQFDPGAVELIGILLADKQPGPFQLEIATITTYQPSP